MLDIKVAGMGRWSIMVSILDCKSSIMNSSHTFAKWKGNVTRKAEINIFMTVWSMVIFLSH